MISKFKYKMAKENLESKIKKAVLNIEKKVMGIYDVVIDLSLKLCHIIKSYKTSYSFDYDKKYERS